MQHLQHKQYTTFYKKYLQATVQNPKKVGAELAYVRTLRATYRTSRRLNRRLKKTRRLN